VGIAVDYSFQPYLFAYHCQAPNMEIEIQKLKLLIGIFGFQSLTLNLL
jgi:hypothetical protein